MIILKPISTEQTLMFYARQHTTLTYSVNLTDESTTKETTYAITGTYVDGLCTIKLTHPFKEGRFYILKVFSSTSLISYQRIYATAQTSFDSYSVLDSFYTPIQKEKTTYTVKA